MAARGGERVDAGDGGLQVRDAVDGLAKVGGLDLLANVAAERQAIGRPKPAAKAVTGSKIKHPFRILARRVAAPVSMRVAEASNFLTCSIHVVVTKNLWQKHGVVMLPDRYAPYAARALQIDNLCGMFLTYADIRSMQGLFVDTITPFGVQHIVYHVEGNLHLDQGRAFFKACRSFAGVEALSRALYLETPRNKIHMVVLSARLGRRVQARPTYPAIARKTK